MAVFWVVNVRVGVILGGYFPRREFSGWELSGGNHPGGSFHVTNESYSTWRNNRKHSI